MHTLCPKKEECGSCSWSHIPYEKQLLQKLSDINGSFAIKKITDLKLTEILPSPVEAHYRNRMDFVIDFEGRVGLRQKGKWWKVIDGHSCFIADERIDTLMLAVRDWAHASGLSYFDRKAHTGLLRYAVIRSSLNGSVDATVTDAGETMITIVTSAPVDDADRANIEAALKNLADTCGATTVVWSINHTISDVSNGTELKTISGSGVIHENVGGIVYTVSPNAFFQTNSLGAAVLQKTVVEFAGAQPGEKILDLYCGTGFFALAFAKAGHDTVGIEIVEDAITDAKTNAEVNGLVDKTNFIATPTEGYDWSQHNADIVILDPPRSGLHDNALQDILRILPKKIVYVSCNFKSFAREYVLLAPHYKATQMRAIDMFPHTPHVELITVLELR